MHKNRTTEWLPLQRGYSFCFYEGHSTSHLGLELEIHLPYKCFVFFYVGEVSITRQVQMPGQ